MRGYLVIDIKRKRSRVVATLEEVARIVEAESADIEWWLEEAGLWKSDRWVVEDIIWISVETSISFRSAATSRYNLARPAWRCSVRY